AAPQARCEWIEEAIPQANASLTEAAERGDVGEVLLHGQCRAERPLTEGTVVSDQAGRFAALIQRLLDTDADRHARVREFQEVVDNRETPCDAREGPAETVTLYRPVGPEELALLRAAGFLRWPPRLPHQPIFYPVTNEDYAAEIASKWNVKDSGSGFVTRFHVKAEFMARFTVQRVGASYHTEWWIPADMLEELNDNIVGTIDVIRSFGG
ncbi:MAG TPA: hypothetical protein VLN08_10470, partial [Vicinamibacterales bacterium]|nr:hypothetical protein [Vicinamibacterales bacterium]